MKKLTDGENLTNFYIADYYSDMDESFIKTIFYKSQDGEIEVVKEVDTYIGVSNKTVKPSLNFSYDFKEGKKSFRIDSLPSNYLIRENQLKLSMLIKKANASSMWVCGTAANEILEKGFPKKYTFIKEQDFKKLQKKFSKQAPKPSKS
ncbi:hypothetical protein [Nibribacter koreensis]|uniref:Uncharacterized protein n=1 Tax=Nibribacter koreensis TaxID=1084519 RepID=A0ABP8FU20_9BACT